MFLARLIYTSEVVEGFDQLDIESILSVARERNAALNVTGVLFFNSRYFLQCLEGSRSNINAIYHRILNDSRHTNPVLLDYREIAERDFSAWQMGYLAETQKTRDLYRQFSPVSDFNAYRMSGESCYRLLKHMATSAPML